MKKALTILAVFALVGVVSCNKKDAPVNPTVATITASDAVVEVGQTAQINATTNSTAPIVYTPDDSGVYTLSATGEVTGVKEGEGSIKLSVAAVEGKFTAAEKTIKVTVKGGFVPPAPASIEIDGTFDDWSALDVKTYKKAVSDPDAPWEGVTEIRCYANAENVFYYIKFDEESLAECKAAETPAMHIRLCINTDGEFESGYKNYFLDGYDFIIEGSIMDEGAFVDFDGTLHQRIDGWVALLEPGNGLVSGKGAGSEFEICLVRPVFNEAANTSTVPMPMGDDFQTGIRFYWNGWDEFSNMPNASIEEEQGNGWGYLLRMFTNK